MSWLSGKKRAKITVSNRLALNEQHELERVLMNCQIEAVSDALIPYLSRMKHLLREYKQGKSLFEDRFNGICEYLEGLKNNPKYALNEFKQKAVINALTLLGSIKIMVHGLADEVNRHNEKAMVSNHYFIKRLPPNLRLYLSPDSWRLYEVYALLYLPMDTIQLNKDLLDDFPNLGNSEPKPSVAVVAPEKINEELMNLPSSKTGDDSVDAGPNRTLPEVNAVPTTVAEVVEEETNEEAKETPAFSVDDIFNTVLGKPTEGDKS